MLVMACSGDRTEMARVLLADSQPPFNEALEVLLSRDDVHRVVGRCSSADGDEVRTNLCQGLGFSRPDRDTNIARIGYVAAKLANHAVAVLVAAISPYRQARDQVRASVDRFVEVHVAAPLLICAQRDAKGLYAKALAGEIPHFTGVSDPYEPPLDPEIVLHTEAESVDESVHQILAWLETHQLTNPTDH